MNIIDIPCRRENFGGVRASAVKYLVIHYTAGQNDTAENNGRYFAREQVGASAHYFVDEDTVVRSVPEEYVAWHCGGSVYYHEKCRNGNSIGVEICTKYHDGRYSFAPEAVERAAGLVRQLMEKYSIPVERVVRHWDVTHKTCPAPFVGNGEAQWTAFLERLEEEMKQEVFEAHMDVYNEALARKEPGSWSEQARHWAEEQGLLQGDARGMHYRSPVTREELVQILYRMRKEEA